MGKQPPQHKNPTNADRTALAPYNFVPITDRLIAFNENENPLLVDHDQYDEKRLTGWIDVELETKSPIYVRAPFTLDEFERSEKEKDGEFETPHLESARNKPDFFYTDDPTSPVIPGSSLRGMLRSLVEILGHGKLTPVSDTPLIYRAVGDTTSHGNMYRDQLFESDPVREHYYTPKFKGGYIRQLENEWYIQPAIEINGTTFGRINHKGIPDDLKKWEKCRNASEIYIEVSDYDFKQVRGGFIHIKQANVARAANQYKPGLEKEAAALVRSGRMFSKRTEAIIFPPNNGIPEKEWIRIPDGSGRDEYDLIAAYINQQSPEQKNLLGDKGVLVDKHPVFYLIEEDRLVFFGHTQMFRIPYRRSPQDMLPSGHTGETLMDFAESVFGRVKRQRGDNRRLQATAGRIFVEDARMLANQEDPWLPGEQITIPRISATPKPTTFQHYLTQSNPDDKSQLSTYNTSSGKATLRGHKLYWHKGNVSRKEFTIDEREIQKEAERKNKDIKQYTRIRPVRAGVKFKFRVHFENLAMAEFGALWWAITLPAKGTFYHKIGMGKPHGLGSIMLTPTFHIVDFQQRYTMLFNNDQFELGLISDKLAQKFRDGALQVFEGFMCKQMNYRLFAQASRIQQLLAMLSWPGPQPSEQKTRYMEIERPDPRAKRGKRNEYRERPVLPDPTHV